MTFLRITSAAPAPELAADPDPRFVRVPSGVHSGTIALWTATLSRDTVI